MTVDTPTERPKSVHHRCAIKSFGGVFVLSIGFRIFCWYRGFVIGLSQISFFFSLPDRTTALEFDKYCFITEYMYFINEYMCTCIYIYLQIVCYPQTILPLSWENNRLLLGLDQRPSTDVQRDIPMLVILDLSAFPMEHGVLRDSPVK